MIRLFRKPTKDIEFTFIIPQDKQHWMDNEIAQKIENELVREMVKHFKARLIHDIDDKELGKMIKKKMIKELLS